MTSHAPETDPASIDARGDDLLEGAELLRDARLEIERELKLGNCRPHVFPVLSDPADNNSAIIDSTKKNQPRLRVVVDNDREDSAAFGSGYMSGRNSCLDTPETSSTVSTRSGGTLPERRHFCTAWYRTPHLAAKDESPPAAEIARSTTSMGRSMQPIVAVSQQPLRAGGTNTMQSMVVRTKDAAKEEFSRNLNRAVEALGAPVRGRPDWLRAKLNKVVSRESCRKWLSGKDMPDQTNMTILVDTLSLSEHQLRTGKIEPARGQDPRLAELQGAWPTLTEAVRNAIMATYAAVKPAQSPTAPAKRRQA